MPLALVKKPSKLPFIETEKEAVEMQMWIQLINRGGSTTALNIDVMKDHLTVSKALEMSNLTVHLSEFVFLWYPLTRSDANKTFFSNSLPLMKALVGFNSFWKNCLETRSQNFRYYLIQKVATCNRPIVSHCLSWINLGDEGEDGRIDTGGEKAVHEERLHSHYTVPAYDRPNRYIKLLRIPVRTRYFTLGRK